MDSFKYTLEKININLAGKPILSISITLIFIILFIFLKINSLERAYTNSNLIFTKSDYKYSKNNKENNKLHYIYASSRGTKYYFYNCKSSIKESNKIYFETELEAIQAGYSLAKACK